jgi:biopolymer transport protein TolR
MMLLLVIFMITAPMMQGGIDVTLPKAEARPLEQKSGMIISVARDGTIAVDGTRMSLRDFRVSLKALAGDRAKQGVYVQADERVDWGLLSQVLGVIQSAGIVNMGLAVEPLSQK